MSDQPKIEYWAGQVQVWGDPHGGCSPVVLPNVAVVSTPQSIGAVILDLEGEPVPEREDRR